MCVVSTQLQFPRPLQLSSPHTAFVNHSVACLTDTCTRYPSICLLVSIYLSIYVCLSVYLSICLYIGLSGWLAGCLSVCCSHLEHRASVKRFVSLQFFNLGQSVELLGRGISPT
jgi:hypothetical protein